MYGQNNSKKVQCGVAWRGVAWRGVAWRGVRACFACLLVVLMVITQVNITAFAEGSDELTFDVSQGNIIISNGTDSGTLKVSYGSSPKKDNIARDKMITITGTSSQNTVKVIEGVSVNITLAGVNIHSQVSGSAALDLSKAGEVQLTLADATKNILKTDNEAPAIHAPDNHKKLIINGNGELKTQGGHKWPAIGGSRYQDIEIRSGTIFATGGENTAGIGGSNTADSGKITILGGHITATGGNKGPGIGVGANAGEDWYTASGPMAGHVIISGGLVTATGGNEADGIGGGYGSDWRPKLSTGENGFAVIDTTSIANKEDKRIWSGIIFDGNNGKVYGNSVTPNTNFEIPQGKTLEIESDNELVIASGITLTNNGTLNLNKGATLTNSGTFTNVGNIINNNGKINGNVVGNGDIINFPKYQYALGNTEARFENKATAIPLALDGGLR